MGSSTHAPIWKVNRKRPRSESDGEFFRADQFPPVGSCPDGGGATGLRHTR